MVRFCLLLFFCCYVLIVLFIRCSFVPVDCYFLLLSCYCCWFLLVLFWIFVFNFLICLSYLVVDCYICPSSRWFLLFCLIVVNAILLCFGPDCFVVVFVSFVCFVVVQCCIMLCRCLLICLILFVCCCFC
jgi:hypothetical protein